jgi:hypothetical protein
MVFISWLGVMIRLLLLLAAAAAAAAYLPVERAAGLAPHLPRASATDVTIGVQGLALRGNEE